MLQSFQKFFCGRFICRSALYTIGGSGMLQKNKGNPAQLHLRNFAGILCPDFVALFCNTPSIAAKPRRISAQNLLANFS